MSCKTGLGRKDLGSGVEVGAQRCVEAEARAWRESAGAAGYNEHKHGMLKSR
jgi:hypothetical protein